MYGMVYSPGEAYYGNYYSTFSGTNMAGINTWGITNAANNYGLPGGNLFSSYDWLEKYPPTSPYPYPDFVHFSPPSVPTVYNYSPMDLMKMWNQIPDIIGLQNIKFGPERLITPRSLENPRMPMPIVIPDNAWPGVYGIMPVGLRNEWIIQNYGL
ncbi:hypothetical protein JXL19_10400 [bacterium]|nr:hypothetical protein [bacterium]